MDWLEGELESDGSRLQEDTGSYLEQSKVHSYFPAHARGFKNAEVYSISTWPIKNTTIYGLFHYGYGNIRI